MTLERFNLTLTMIHLAVYQCHKTKDWNQLETLAKQFGYSFKITKKEIRYVLENPIADIIEMLED